MGAKVYRVTATIDVFLDWMLAALPWRVWLGVMLVIALLVAAFFLLL